MTPAETIRALLTAAALAAPEDEQSATRKAEHALWATQAVAAFSAARSAL